MTTVDRPCPAQVAPAGPCGRPRWVNPRTGRAGRDCYWHRLLRSTLDLQLRQAEIRAATHGESAPRQRVPEREWPPGERWCSGCQGFVPLFYCTGTRCKAHEHMARRAGHVARTYGLEADGLAELAKVQDNRCGICRKHQRHQALAVDHDHQTGAVRGLLCKRCNHDLLGAGFDSLNILRAAVRYLETPPAGGDWTPPEETES